MYLRTSPTFGNLLDKTTNLGAQCSIGFYNTIETYPGNDFDNAFFSYAVQGYDVLTSLTKALNDVRTYNGRNAGNLDSYVVSFKPGVSSTLYLRN